MRRKRKQKLQKDLLRQLELCHRLHDPRYHSPGFPSVVALPSAFALASSAVLALPPRLGFIAWLVDCVRTGSVFLRNWWNGAVKTAATSCASNWGIRDISGSALAPVCGSNECRSAMHGRTTTSVLARLAGNSQRCSIAKGAGRGWLMSGRPISSQASRRAVWKGVSERVSARPGKINVG